LFFLSPPLPPLLPAPPLLPLSMLQLLLPRCLTAVQQLR
jgi:hypothetical protein